MVTEFFRAPAANCRLPADADESAAGPHIIVRLPPVLRFLALGGLAAAVNLVMRALLQPLLGFELAVAVAYICGMIVAYVLFRAFVFGASSRSIASEAWRFTIVNLVSMALVWVISVGLARIVFPALAFTWHADDIAHVAGLLSPALTSWIGHRRYTFRP